MPEPGETVSGGWDMAERDSYRAVPCVVRGTGLRRGRAPADYPRPVPATLVLAVDTATPAVTAALVAIGRAGTAPAAAAPAAPASGGAVTGDPGTVSGGGATGGGASGARVPAGRRAAVTVLSLRRTVDPRRHGELLAPSVSRVLAEAGRRPADVGAVVAGLGPGPFTGLRVGLATAAAFADALGVPAYGVCSLDAVAAPVVDESTGGRVVAAIDARRREVYWAVYDEAGRRLDGPGVDRPDVLAARLPALGVTAMCGAGARAYADVLGLPLLAADYPDPAALVALAADRIAAGAPAGPLTPLYLRRPDAVEPGPPKAVSRG